MRSNRPGGKADPAAGDLEVRAGWSHLQHVGDGTKVMPGGGRVETRAAETPAEQMVGGGREVLDVYLNDTTFWAGVPRSVWELKIGGFQVLKKWLSYREHGPSGASPQLGRPLTLDEARGFTELVQRLAAYCRLADDLNKNYHAVRKASTNLTSAQS